MAQIIAVRIIRNRFFLFKYYRNQIGLIGWCRFLKVDPLVLVSFHRNTNPLFFCSFAACSVLNVYRHVTLTYALFFSTNK
jgi:hypothetical protein